jgi:hypothetical protein
MQKKIEKIKKSILFYTKIRIMNFVVDESKKLRELTDSHWKEFE